MFGKKSRLYLDASAATPLSKEVRERLLELLDLYGNPGAIHEEGVAAARALETIRKEAAAAIEAHADEIVFTASGTEANNLALFGAVSGDVSDSHGISTVIEHPSVLEPLKRLEQKGMNVTYLPVSAEGLIDIPALEEAITEKTVLITIGYINSEIGVIQDIHAVAKVVRAQRKARGENGRRIALHIDASQAPLWLRLRVPALGCDLMTLDAQKMLGPKGIGLLYVRRGLTLVPQTLGGGQERGIRSGTENVPLAGAFARALSLAQQSCEENATRIARVRDALAQAITTEIPDALVNGSMERRAPNNLNISIPGLVGERAVVALSAYGISASTRSACSAKEEELSHVLRALGTGTARAKEAIRFSLLPNATEKEMHIVAQGVAKAASKYKNIDAIAK